MGHMEKMCIRCIQIELKPRLHKRSTLITKLTKTSLHHTAHREVALPSLGPLSSRELQMLYVTKTWRNQLRVVEVNRPSRGFLQRGIRVRIRLSERAAIFMLGSTFM